MRYTVFKFEQEASEGSLTYVDGLGFISVNNRLRYLRSLKRSSAFFCFLILLYFLCRNTLSAPLLYIGYYTGMNVQINPATGWIRVSDSTAFFLALLLDFLSLLLPIALASFAYRDQLYNQRLFAPARHSAGRIAVPLLVAFGMLGQMFSLFLSDLAHALGFGLTAVAKVPAFLSAEVAPYYVLVSDLMVAILSTVFIQGIALRILRRYGDGFAVVCSAMLSALLSNNPTTAVSVFLVSLGAGYFTIRGGSIRPVLFARILCVLLFSYANEYLPLFVSSASLVEVIRIVGALLIITAAFFSYVHFIRMDANAFRLVHPTDGLSNKKKLSCFCSSLFFFLLIFRLIVNLVETIEIVG